MQLLGNAVLDIIVKDAPIRDTRKYVHQMKS